MRPLLALALVALMTPLPGCVTAKRDFAADYDRISPARVQVGRKPFDVYDRPAKRRLMVRLPALAAIGHALVHALDLSVMAGLSDGMPGEAEYAAAARAYLASRAPSGGTCALEAAFAEARIHAYEFRYRCS